VRPLDTELVEDATEVARVAVHRVVEAGGLVGPPVARHVGRDRAREPRDGRYEVVPVVPGPWVPVDEDDCLAVSRWPGVDDRRSHAVDDDARVAGLRGRGRG